MLVFRLRPRASLALILATIVALHLAVPDIARANPERFKILHVMSYHATWKWNREQFQGFKAALADLPTEYRVVELNSKRQSSNAAILAQAKQADAIIQNWKPDLLYANDDIAQKYVSQNYVDTDLPIVFSAVNRDPSEYGFTDSTHVTGVIEHEHFVPTIRLLKQIVPDVKRIAILVDPDPTWKGVMARIRATARQIPDIEITHWVLADDLDEFRERLTHYKTQSMQSAHWASSTSRMATATMSITKRFYAGSWSTAGYRTSRSGKRGSSAARYAPSPFLVMNRATSRARWRSRSSLKGSHQPTSRCVRAPKGFQ